MTAEVIRAKVLNEVIGRLGADRAVEANRKVGPIASNPSGLGPKDNPTGFEGVDEIPSRIGRRFRARIRYCSALQGRDVRITLTSRAGDAEEAGFYFAAAHVRLWGSASRFAPDFSAGELEKLLYRG